MEREGYLLLLWLLVAPQPGSYVLVGGVGGGGGVGGSRAPRPQPGPPHRPLPRGSATPEPRKEEAAEARRDTAAALGRDQSADDRYPPTLPGRGSCSPTPRSPPAPAPPPPGGGDPPPAGPAVRGRRTGGARGLPVASAAGKEKLRRFRRAGQGKPLRFRRAGVSARSRRAPSAGWRRALTSGSGPPALSWPSFCQLRPLGSSWAGVNPQGAVGAA